VSARRLNDGEKKIIVGLYRESGETAMSLAEQFGVSNTTISRILKAGIESVEYDRLIQQKRRGVDHTPTLDIAIPALIEPPEALAIPEVLTIPQPEPVLPLPEELDSSGRRLRRRRTTSQPIVESDTPISEPITREITTEKLSAEKQSIVSVVPAFVQNFQKNFQSPDRMNDRFPSLHPISTPAIAKSNANVEAEPDFEPDIEPEPLPDRPIRKVIQVGVAKRRPVELEEEEEEEEDDDDILPPVTEEISAILDEDFGEDEDDDDEDDNSEEDDDDGEIYPDAEAQRDLTALHVQQFMRVIPLDQALMPRICYVVVDRSAELVVRPLKDFGDMGQIPISSDQTMTLPIFDNPRGAKRFANARTERVIKVPDSQVFRKTSDNLRSKGITYLFVEGQLYSL
jgi:transcriptional regulator with XRE-family HTH domain